MREGTQIFRSVHSHSLSLPAIRKEHRSCRDARSFSRREHDPVSGCRDLCSLSLSLSPGPIILPLLSSADKRHGPHWQPCQGGFRKAGFQGAKKLDTIKGGHNTHAEHAASMSARVVEREESMALSAWHLRDNAPRSTLLIDEHDLRLGTSLVGFM